MKSARIKNLWLAISIMLFSGNVAAQIPTAGVNKARVADHWTAERKANAIPRDLVIDPRGLGYLRLRDRSLVPYGHDIAAQATPRSLAISPFGQPGADTTPPTISNTDPVAGATIGASKTFSATVTDASGVKSVTFRIQKAGSNGQSFSATKSAGDVWSVALSGFTDGTWNWSIDAKDSAARGGNTATAGPFDFTVSTGGGGGGTGGTGTNDQWTAGGVVQNAAGRIYFEMPNNAQRRRWTAYVCSGAVATDSTTARSVILTAAHCVYDDVNKAFARNVMFIPDQAGGGSKTDLNCSNDPMGCWIPSFGVVDVDWTNRTFPANIPWDYAFYVVADSGAHQGTTATSNALDSAAGSLPVSFDAPSGVFTHALGYSYSEDPKFMYCAEDRVTESEYGDWWLGSCGLTGGSSGGPWVQPMDISAGTGPIISVNSWGYTNSVGMAGPKLVATTAGRIFCNAKSSAFFSAIDGAEGIIVYGASTVCP